MTIRKKTILAIYEDDLTKLKTIADKISLAESKKMTIGTVKAYPADAVSWLLAEYAQTNKGKK
jgi:hypothetical protein